MIGIVLVAVGGAVLVGTILFLAALVWASRLSPRGQEANRRLVDAFDPETDPRLAESAGLSAVWTANEHEGTGEDVLVPVATIPLAAAEPEMEDVRSLTADVLREVHPVFRDEHVHHYDVRFEFGEGWFGGLEGQHCRRMAVPPELADRLIDDPGYRPDDLARDVREADDGDEVTPPVHWGDCVIYDGARGATVAATAGAT